MIDLERRAPGGREEEAEGICEVGAVELRLVDGLVEARCDVVGREDVCVVGVRREQETNASTVTFEFLLLSETYVYLLEMSVTGKISHNMMMGTGKSLSESRRITYARTIIPLCKRVTFQAVSSIYTTIVNWKVGLFGK